MAERGVQVEHTTIHRWVQDYAPELDKRSRPFLNSTNDSWRVDETYIEVKGELEIPVSSGGSEGNTLDFMLSAKRNGKAAVRFCRKVLGAKHTHTPKVITVDKNVAYPVAMDELKEDKTLKAETELRQRKSLNNIIEQDHRNVKRIVKPMMGFQSFNTARRTLRGIEAVNMIRKGQVKGINPEDSVSQVEFINEIFGVVA